ncbi:UvrD-helicase domain-containing protein [Marinactinospora rubrisoli]|uniref:UDP-N-acetylglucosamine kinase n=1 Tax=Marinactinospora rubrisoli TaxID=2715399 RepID=A0ABW2KPQ6_9ACTN
MPPEQPTGPITRARAGLKALEVLQELEKTPGATPTAEQLRALKAWSGWGPMAPAMERTRKGAWEEIGDRLEELLSEERYGAAYSASYGSFYTPQTVTAACWDLLRGLGFSKGRILEPGCGHGTFIATTPAGMNVEWVGIERDPTSAAIASYLHPGATILNRTLEEANLPTGAVDAVIGNVPFGNTTVFDGTAPKGVTDTLHDYAIWTSVQALAPGGVAVLVTSCGTLDKLATPARRALDQEAVLLGAIRLPNEAFTSAGTSTPTDIVILRRRKGDEPATDHRGGKAANVPSDPLLAAMVKGTWLSAGHKANRWFEAFPDSLIGRIEPDNAPGRSFKVTPPPDWETALQSAVAATVERATSAGLGWDVLQAPAPLAEILAEREDGLKEGRILTVEREVPARGGKVQIKPVLAQVAFGEIEELRTATGKLRPATKETLRLIELRDAAVELFDADADQEIADEDLAPIRERAAALYDAYHADYGPIGRCTVSYSVDADTDEVTERRQTPNLGGMRDDVDFATLLALENYDLESNTATKADILLRRVHRPAQLAERAETPHEAVAMSLNVTNRVDIPTIGRLLDIPTDQIEPTLLQARAAFRDPADPAGGLVPAGEYLSGMVGRKLETARRAAERDDSYAVNVAALEEVQPAPLTPDQIDAPLGATWIPPEDVRQFAKETLNIEAKVGLYRSVGDWVVTVQFGRDRDENVKEWGTRDFCGHELLEKALNNRTPNVYKYDGDRRVLDQEATDQAALAQRRLEDRFSEWVWEDPARADRLVAAYHEVFSANRKPAYDGGALTFPGMAATFEPYATQRNFVAMSLALQGSICAHEMGGGKTAIMFMTAVKHVQLGLATNPIIVVPNGLLDEITREGKQLFPSARILMATERDLDGPRARKRFAAKCAANQWHAIVMTESMFSRIPVHPTTEADFHARARAEKRTTLLTDAKKVRQQRVKAVAAKIDSHVAQIKKLLSSPKDDGMYHEHLGSTMLLCDEASDWMRNLGMLARAEGYSMPSPARTMNAFLKVQHTRAKGGKVVLFTGTPWVDKALEMYTQLLMVHPEGLEARGIFTAEQWVKNFVRFQHVLEPSMDGGQLRLRKRPMELINKQELQALYAECADVKRGSDLPVRRPQLRQATHPVQATPIQRMHARYLGKREKELRGWRTEKGQDTYFTLITEGRKAALDPVLADLPADGHTKLDEMADQIATRYHATKDFQFPHDPPSVSGLLQLGFITLGVPQPAANGTPPDDRTYGRLRDRLIARGVPAEMIRFVHEAEKPEQRAALYSQCRNGQVAVLLGSFKKMGYGTNVQDRLSDIHIADVAWNPADIKQAIKRAHRPGNHNTEITAHFYPVKGTVDNRMLSLNHQKISVEEQFFRDDGERRMSAQFGEITASELGDLAAIAADNPVLLRLQQARRRHAALMAEASGHRVQQVRMKARAEQRAEEIEGVLTTLRSARWLARVVAASDNDTVRAYRSALTGDALDRYLRENATRVLRGGVANSVISYKNVSVNFHHPGGDAPLLAELKVSPSSVSLQTRPDLAREFAEQKYPLAGVERPLDRWLVTAKDGSLTTVLLGLINGIDDHVRELEQRLESLEETNAKARKLAQRPFPRQDQLEKLANEITELEEQARATAAEEPEVADAVHPSEVLFTDEVSVRSATRPPSRWRSADVHAHPLARTIHGLAWVLDHNDLGYEVERPFHAAITGVGGTVEATIHTPAALRDEVLLRGCYSTFGHALRAIRAEIASQLAPEGAEWAAEMWGDDIERLTDTTPRSLLRDALNANDAKLSPNALVEAAPETLADTYSLIKLNDGSVHAAMVERVDVDHVHTAAEHPWPRSQVTEMASLDPRRRYRFRADATTPWTLDPALLTDLTTTTAEKADPDLVKRVFDRVPLESPALVSLRLDLSRVHERPAGAPTTLTTQVYLERVTTAYTDVQLPVPLPTLSAAPNGSGEFLYVPARVPTHAITQARVIPRAATQTAPAANAAELASAAAEDSQDTSTAQETLHDAPAPAHRGGAAQQQSSPSGPTPPATDINPTANSAGPARPRAEDVSPAHQPPAREADTAADRAPQQRPASERPEPAVASEDQETEQHVDGSEADSLAPAPERFTDAETRARTALQALAELLKRVRGDLEPSRDDLNAALSEMLDHGLHKRVRELIAEADTVDPGAWGRRDLLRARALVEHDPEALKDALVIFVDYEQFGLRCYEVHGAQYRGTQLDKLLRNHQFRWYEPKQCWRLNPDWDASTQYRWLRRLRDALDSHDHPYLLSKSHKILSDQHAAAAAAGQGDRAGDAASADGPADAGAAAVPAEPTPPSQEEATMTAGSAPDAGSAPAGDIPAGLPAVTASGHIGEVADVAELRDVTVTRISRFEQRGKPRWLVAYQVPGLGEVVSFTGEAPTVTRGQRLERLRVKITEHREYRGDAQTVVQPIVNRSTSAFTPTEEQQAIRQAALDGKKMVVQAAAGTGKTSTLLQISEALADQGRKGAYVVYGRDNADEAATKLGHLPVHVNTLHGFAHKAVGGRYARRLRGDRTPDWDAAGRRLGLLALQLPDLGTLERADLARLVDRTVYRFELSADAEISALHLPRLPGATDADQRLLRKTLEPVLERAWADMRDPTGTLFRFRHDTYVKIWQLLPEGPRIDVGGRNQGYLMIDEAQDINPVAEDILRRQTHLQQIWVGDSSQAIHEWRGARDALIRQDPDVALTLTQSFRFGEPVAVEGNKWLELIGAPLRVRGTPGRDTVVLDEEPAGWRPDLILARTNAGVFTAALAELRQGRRVAIAGGTDDLSSLVDAAAKLQSGQRTSHPDLAHFRSWEQVMKVAREHPDDLGQLAPFVRLVDTHGVSSVRSALEQMRQSDPDVRVSTAHRAKGLEADHVRIGEDFAWPQDRKLSTAEMRQESQLAYVAITRARRTLVRGSLAFVDDLLADKRAETNQAGAAETAALASGPAPAEPASTATATPDGATPQDEPEQMDLLTAVDEAASEQQAGDDAAAAPAEPADTTPSPGPAPSSVGSTTTSPAPVEEPAWLAQARDALRRLREAAPGVREERRRDFNAAVEGLLNHDDRRYIAAELIQEALKADPAGAWERQHLRDQTLLPSAPEEPAVRIDSDFDGSIIVRGSSLDRDHYDHLQGLVQDLGFERNPRGHNMWRAVGSPAEQQARVQDLIKRLEDTGTEYYGEDHYQLHGPAEPKVAAAWTALEALETSVPERREERRRDFNAILEELVMDGWYNGAVRVLLRQAGEIDPAGIESREFLTTIATTGEYRAGDAVNSEQPAASPTAASAPTAETAPTAQTPAQPQPRGSEASEPGSGSSSTTTAAGDDPTTGSRADMAEPAPAPAREIPMAVAAARNALELLRGADRKSLPQHRQSLNEALRALTAEPEHHAAALDVITEANRADPAGGWERQTLRDAITTADVAAAPPSRLVRVEFQEGVNIVMRWPSDDPTLRAIFGTEKLKYSKQSDLWAGSGWSAARQRERLGRLLVAFEEAGYIAIAEENYERLRPRLQQPPSPSTTAPTPPPNAAKSGHSDQGEVAMTQPPPEPSSYDNKRSNFRTGQQQEGANASGRRRPTLRMGVTGADSSGPQANTDQNSSQQQRRPTLTLGVDGSQADAPDQRQSTDRKAQRAVTAADGDDAQEQNSAASAVRIDARVLRTNHKKWQRLLQSEGRAEAIRQVDPDVHKRALTECTKAFEAGQDVHLIMPSNDPKAIATYIELARKHGYQIQLAVRVGADAKREMATIRNMFEHAKNNTAHQAVSLREQETELANMRALLEQAHKDKLVDSIKIYPADSNTPAYVNELRHDRNERGERVESVWSNPRGIAAAVSDLRRQPLTNAEKEAIRREVNSIYKELPRADQVDEEGLRWRNEIARGLNGLAQAMGMDPLDEDLARRMTMESNGDALAQPGQQAAQPSNDGSAEATQNGATPNGAAAENTEPSHSSDGAPSQPEEPPFDPLEDLPSEEQAIKASNSTGGVKTSPKQVHEQNASAAPAHAEHATPTASAHH